MADVDTGIKAFDTWEGNYTNAINVHEINKTISITESTGTYVISEMPAGVKVLAVLGTSLTFKGTDLTATTTGSAEGDLAVATGSSTLCANVIKSNKAPADVVASLTQGSNTIRSYILYVPEGC